MKKQGKDRLFEVMSRLDSTFKTKLNENIYVDDNAPQFLEYVIHHLPKVTNIAIKDPNSSSRWDGFFMRDVNFKNSDYDNAYFYYETSGVGHDEEGQRAFSEPKSGVIAVPFSVMVDIDNSYADTNGSTLIINSDLQDEIKTEDNLSEAGSSGLEENTLNEDSSKSPINKFVYFGYNYPSINFIDEVWSDNPNLAKHLKDKFMGYYKQYGSDAVMNRFYVELSSENQRQLEEWIINNYSG
jgi:hypothetical protein